MGVLPEKRWRFTLLNTSGAAVNVTYYLPTTKYTGADLQRVL